MKKQVFVLGLCLCLAFSLVGCGGGSSEITLDLAFGERTGTYSGDLVDGIPNGEGEFTTKNDAGEEWTYEGSFKNGHFEGEGKTTWKSGQIEIGTYKDDIIVPMNGTELKRFYATPEDYKNHCVEIIGVVFTAPEYDENGVYLQMWGDIKNSNNNIIVYIPDTEFEVHEGDYIKTVGIVGDQFTGTNAFGAEVTVPTITAREYEVLSYVDAVSPTLQSIEINKTLTQYGYSVTLQKVEFAEQETRVYLKVDNDGTDKFSVYSFNAKITQDGKQYDEQDNWEAEYPDIQTDLLVGNTTEGIIAFPALEAKAFTLLVEGRSDNWHEDIKPYSFDIEP